MQAIPSNIRYVVVKTITQSKEANVERSLVPVQSPNIALNIDQLLYLHELK